MYDMESIFDIDIEDYYDPLLDEEDLEIDWDYIQYCIEEAERMIEELKSELRF